MPVNAKVYVVGVRRLLVRRLMPILGMGNLVF